MAGKTLQEIVEMPLTGLRFDLADKLLRANDPNRAIPVPKEHAEILVSKLDDAEININQLINVRVKLEAIEEAQQMGALVSDLVWDLLQSLELIRMTPDLPELTHAFLGAVIREWRARIFPTSELKLCLDQIRHVAGEEDLQSEIENAYAGITRGLAPKEVNLDTPARQLLWAAHILYLIYNPVLLRAWPANRRGKGGAFGTTHLWKQLVGSHQAKYLRMLFGQHVYNLLRNKDLLVGWGPPGSWFSFSAEPAPGRINCDLLYSMLVGFDHARACAVHEIGHAVQTRALPQYLRDLSDAADGAESQLEGEAIKQELRLKQYFLNACEDNCINRYTEEIGRIFGQDYGFSLSYFYTTIGDVGRRYVRKEIAYDEESPENQFKNLTYIISRTFLANQELFSREREGWESVGARPEWIKGLDRDDPEKELENEPAFQQLMDMCEEVEYYFPPLQEMAGGPQHYAQQAEAYAEKRFELIQEIWDLYAENIVRQILDKDKEDVDDAMENFQMEMNKQEPPPKKDKEKPKEEKQEEQPKDPEDDSEEEKKEEVEKPPNPNPPTQSDNTADNWSDEDLEGDEPDAEEPPEGMEDGEEGDESDEGGGEAEAEDASDGDDSEEGADADEGDDEEGSGDPEPQGAGAPPDDSDGSPDKKEKEEKEPESKEKEEAQPEDENVKEVPPPEDADVEEELRTEDPNEEQQKDAADQEEQDGGGEEEGEDDGPGDDAAFEEMMEQLMQQLKEMKQEFHEDDEAEQKLQEDEENPEAELIREEEQDIDENQEPPDDDQEQDGEGERGDAQGGDEDSRGVLDREYVPEESLSSIEDLMEALKQADEEAELQKQRKERERPRFEEDDELPEEHPPMDIPPPMNLDELAHGDWGDFSRRVAMHGPVIALMARALERLKVAQLKLIHRIGRKHQLIPPGGDLRRFDQQAMHALLQRIAKKEKFDKDHLSMFRRDDRISAPSRPTRIILIDGSRSMSMGSQPYPMDKAIQEAVIDYMASKMAGYDTYITMFGPKNPLVLAKPGDNIFEIGKRIEKVHGGLNTMTFLAPALLTSIEMVAHRKKFSEPYVGFTNFVIYSDGDIDDMRTSKEVIHQIYQHAPKSTFDFVMITNKQATQMDVLINTMDIHNPLHDIGVVRSNASRAHPMALVSTYKLTNRINAARSGFADPAFVRGAQFKRLLKHLTRSVT